MIAQLSLKTALQNTGWNGAFLAHKMEWFGEAQTGDPTKKHRVTRYSSIDHLAVAAQLSNMQAVGIDGVISTWFGPTVSSYIHAAAIETASQCAERQMLFALLMDPWICKSAGRKQNDTRTDAQIAIDKAQLIINALNDPTAKAILNTPSYLPEKALLDFNTGADLSMLAVAFPTYKFWKQGVDFAWPNIDNTVINLQVQHSSTSMKVPAVCPNFFDGGRLDLVKGNGLNGAGRNYEGSVWVGTPTPPPTRRVIDHQAGNLYLDTVGTLVNCRQAPYAGLVSWNDHDEGTGIEQFVVMLTAQRVGQ